MIKPFLNNVLIKCIYQTTTKSGIILAENSSDLPYIAKVIAVGLIEDDNKIFVKENDVVYIPKHCGIKIEYEGEEYLIVNYKDILAIEEAHDE